MEIERLITYFDSSPSARLLRSPNAAYIVHFFVNAFKVNSRIAVPHSVLISELENYQDEIRQSVPDVLIDRASVYLTNWSTGTSRFLHRSHDLKHDEAVYELAPHTEEVMKFLDQVLNRDWEFVGTESRLKRIIETLNDIVVRGSNDPEERLADLYGRRESIEKEIRAIEAGEEVEVYSETAIKERFAGAINDLNSLQGDFRAVEAAFKSITRDVQQLQLNDSGTRGEILEYALDAEDSLKSQDQGVSFDEFVRLVLSERKQDELDSIVQKLDNLNVLVDQGEKKRQIRGMMDSLSLEAEKVIQTTRRLSATLRRLLDSRASESRHHLASVLAEIRRAACERAEQSVDDRIQLAVETQIEISNAFERKLWVLPVTFEQPKLHAVETDGDEELAAFKRFAQLRRIDWKRLRRCIADHVDGRESLAMSELLELAPVEGELEILALIQIAIDDGHFVSDQEKELVAVGSHGSDPNRLQENSATELSTFLYEIPKVVFWGRGLPHEQRFKSALPNVDGAGHDVATNIKGVDDIRDAKNQRRNGKPR